MDMAQKKPVKNKPVIEEEEKAEEPEVPSENILPEQSSPAPPPPAPAAQLAEILEQQQNQIANLTNTVNQLTQALGNRSMGSRPSSVIRYEDSRDEEAPPQKQGMNPMEIFKMITDVMNNPIVQKITDKFLGGGEEQAETIKEALPTPEEIRIAREMQAYRDGQMKKMDGWQERFMEATVKNLELINLKASKELESDLTG